VPPSAPLYEAEAEVPPDARRIREALRRVMWEKVGIIRCAESLAKAREAIRPWMRWAGTAFLSRPGLELRNMLTASALIVHAAAVRRNSVGAHYRSDFREKTPGWDRHYAFTRETGILAPPAVKT